MSTIEQTLRRARQVDQKFKVFMAKKVESDKSMEQTMRKIKETQQTIANTKQTIGKIDSLYDNFQKRFSEAINAALQNVKTSVLFNVSDPDWKPNKISQKQFVQNLKKHKKILFLTGAGMSVASGIPTFRGAKGFWDKQNLKNEMFENVKTPEQILTLTHFQSNQFQTWKWLSDFLQVKTKAKPNKGHLSLNAIIRQLIASDKKSMLVTQNIDDFHVEAKSDKKQKDKRSIDYNISEIHGNIKKLRCDNCSQAKKQIQFYNFKDYLKQINAKQSPRCPKCECKLRPHIMFFDQFYSELYNHVETVQQFEKQIDLLIVIGTALQTGLSRQIVQKALQKNICVIEINIECEIKRPNTMWIEGKADQILDKVKYQIWKSGL